MDYARHADTIVLARYDPSARRLDLLSIPRDTKIDLPQIKVRRINEVYAYAFRTKKDHDFSSRELIHAVQRLLFFNSTSTLNLQSGSGPEIPFYAQLDYDGFKKAIDLLGGVEVTVDEPMHYDDQWGKLHIHFEPGNYLLNGQKALEYVRYRSSTGDFGRVVRQQEFILNVLNRFKNPLNLFKLPRIFLVSIPSIKTNLGFLERLLVLWELKDLPKTHIRLMQLPGKAQSGFWVPDSDGVAATAALLIGNGWEKAEPHAASIPQEVVMQAKRITVLSQTSVEVWNASSKKGLALEVVRKLRSAGFDVVKWGNYSSRQVRTLVRDHKGDSEKARAIAAALASGRVEVFTRVETNPLVDVEVILGEDYQLTKE